MIKSKIVKNGYANKPCSLKFVEVLEADFSLKQILKFPNNSME